MKFRLLLLFVLFFVSACASSAGDENADMPLPPTTSAPAAGTMSPPISGEETVIYGQTEEGAFFHGSPDAPVTLTDYSDFL